MFPPTTTLVGFGPVLCRFLRLGIARIADIALICDFVDVDGDLSETSLGLFLTSRYCIVRFGYESNYVYYPTNMIFVDMKWKAADDFTREKLCTSAQVGELFHALFDKVAAMVFSRPDLKTSRRVPYRHSSLPSSLTRLALASWVVFFARGQVTRCAGDNVHFVLYGTPVHLVFPKVEGGMLTLVWPTLEKSMSVDIPHLKFASLDTMLTVNEDELCMDCVVVFLLGRVRKGLKECLL